MLSKIFIEELVQDTQVNTPFLVSAKSLRKTKYGDPFLCVTLTDRTGSIEGRAWAQAEEIASRFDTQDFVITSGTITQYQEQLQIKVLDMERLSEEDVIVQDYLRTSQWPHEAMYAQLKELVLDHVSSQSMQQFFRTLFGDEDLMYNFKRSPAAKNNHHNYLSGLIEHVLSMARIAVQLTTHYDHYYPNLINKEILLAGVILHDLGKVQELSYKKGFAYTTHGQLIGHITHGVELVNTVVARMPQQLSDSTIMHIKHLILSHHGRLDYGAPVPPRTPEAMLLHQIDMIDSRMNMCAQAKDQLSLASQEQELWSDYNRALDTKLYFGHRDEPMHRNDFTSAHDSRDLIGPGVVDPQITLSHKAPESSRTKPERTPLSQEPLNLNLFGD